MIHEFTNYREIGARTGNLQITGSDVLPTALAEPTNASDVARVIATVVSLQQLLLVV